MLALAGLDGRIRLHDLATGQRARILEGHADAVFSLAFAPEGDSLVSGSGDQTVRRWDTATGEQTACLDGHHGAVYQVGFSPDGRRLVSAGTDGEVIVWDAGNGARLASPSLSGQDALRRLHAGRSARRRRQRPATLLSAGIAAARSLEAISKCICFQ